MGLNGDLVGFNGDLMVILLGFYGNGINIRL